MPDSPHLPRRLFGLRRKNVEAEFDRLRAENEGLTNEVADLRGKLGRLQVELRDCSQRELALANTNLENAAELDSYVSHLDEQVARVRERAKQVEEAAVERIEALRWEIHRLEIERRSLEGGLRELVSDVQARVGLEPEPEPVADAWDL